MQAIQTQFGLTFEPLILLSQSTLDFLELKAAEFSGEAQPDLAGMMVIHGPHDILEASGQILIQFDELEWVDFAGIAADPPCDDPNPTCQAGLCGDLCPSTPDFFACRRDDPAILDYHGPNPGIDMQCAWTFGGRGQTVQVADCEDSYSRDHEDLCSCRSSIPPPPGCNIQEPAQQEFFQGGPWHGNASLGILAARENEFGWTGLVPESPIWFFSVRPTFEPSTYQEITSAIANAAYTLLQDGISGDVILLELQTLGGQPGGIPDNLPIEVEESAYTVIRIATQAGLNVVEPAGNGGVDLDCPNCAACPGAEYCSFLETWHERRDSGAIIVGAGTADICHDRIGESNYGSPVHVQGWGENIFTLGYGYY